MFGGSYQVLCSVAIEIDLRINATIEYTHLELMYTNIDIIILRGNVLCISVSRSVQEYAHRVIQLK